MCYTWIKKKSFEISMLVVKVTNQKSNLLHLDHQKLQIQKVLQKSYNKMITCDPDLKQIFSDPPMISFGWAPNIWDKVVQANHSGHKSYQPILPAEWKSYIDDLINHSKTVTNTISNQTTGLPMRPAQLHSCRQACRQINLPAQLITQPK